MDVISTCPLRVASVVWQPRAGAWALTVVCKATFQLQPGVSPLAGAQEATDDDEGHWDNDESRSLRAPSDLVPFKARADVLLVGHAFAPGGQPARSLPVRLAVGRVDKRIEVWCDRIFWHEGRLLEGQPFTRMPLRYERAAGGPGTANPVGMRFDAPPDAHGAVPVPNLQPPGLQVTRRGDTFAPVGLGPIAPGWPGRAGKLGRHAAGWSHRQWRAQPLPGDLDRAYFNAAPPDQQVESIEPDERLALEHLHPEHPRLETRLPGVEPAARMTAGGRAGEEIAMAADTLWIDTDRGLATVVWRGRVPLSHAGEEGRVTVSRKGTAPQGAVAAGATMALGPGGVPGSALPFGEAPAVMAARPFDEAPAVMGTLMGGSGGAPALPFGPAKSPWVGVKPQPAASRETAPVDTGTVYGVKGKAYDVLPFPEARAPLPPPPPKVEPVAPVEIAKEETPPAPEPVVSAAPAETPEPPAAAPPVEVAIEKCAAIAASIARRPDDRAKILEENQLGAADWTAAEERWNKALKEEAARGKRGLLQAYDAAYVGRLEEERGPIELAEYARLVVATERGRLAEELAEMTLPREAVVRNERVWLKKVVGDPALGKRVKAAVKAARDG
jgi:hypothetical protein